MKTIAAAFVTAKGAFGPALKDKTNPAFRSKYADLGACIDAVEEALLKNGIVFIQETSEDQTGVTIETVFLHSSGEMIRCGKLHVPAAKQDPQGYGSALTYARRYSLMAACGIAPEDDDGNAASKPARTRPALVDSRTGEVLEGGTLEEQLQASLTQKTGARAAAAADAGSRLEPVVKNSLSKLSARVNEAFKKSAAAAFDLIEEQGLNGDEKAYLWGLLDDSKLRSAMKQEGMVRGLTAMKETTS